MGFQLKNYAPSEYHVGPRRPLSEKLTAEDSVSEGANSSGRNTPVDPMDGEDDRDTETPHQNVAVFGSGVQQQQRATSSDVVQTFTQFAITSQGPSITQPSTPSSLRSQGNTVTSRSRPTPHASAESTVKNPAGGQTMSSRVNSVDLTFQHPVPYPYSVESRGHSVQPLSVESTTHVSFTIRKHKRCVTTHTYVHCNVLYMCNCFLYLCVPFVRMSIHTRSLCPNTLKG